MVTKEELRDKLFELIAFSKDCDPEAAHRKADRLLLEYINDPDVTRFFEKIKKYYA